MSELTRAVRPARIARVARVMRLDARQGPVVAAVPGLAVLGAVTGLEALAPGVVDWDDTVAAAGESVRWLGPVAAVLAAWTGIRGHRLDYLRALGARSPAAAPLHDLTLLASVCLSGYGLGALIVSGRALTGSGVGAVHLLGLLAGAAVLFLLVVAGYLAGRLWGHPVTVVCVAAGTAAWSTARPADGWLGSLPPGRPGPVDLFDELQAGVLAAQLFWSAGLAAGLIFAYLAWVTRRPALLLVTGLAVAVSFGCAGRLSSVGGVSSGPGRVTYACRDWPIRVCVHPALEDGLPALSAALAPTAARLAGTPGAFVRVEQRADREPPGIRGGVAGFHLADLSPGYERRAVRQIGTVLGRCADERRDRPGTPQAQVRAWLLDEPVPARPSALFAHWTEEQRRAWFGSHYPFFRACALLPSDFR